MPKWVTETKGRVEENRQMEKRATELALMNWVKWYVRFPMQEFITSYISWNNEVKEGYGSEILIYDSTCLYAF